MDRRKEGGRDGRREGRKKGWKERRKEGKNSNCEVIGMLIKLVVVTFSH